MMMKFLAVACFVAAAQGAKIRNEGRVLRVSGRDVVFFPNQDKQTTVSDLSDGIAGLSTKLEEKLAIMSAVDEGLNNKVGALREDTDALMDAVRTDFATFKAESLATQAAMTAAFGEGLRVLGEQTENARNAMGSDYTNKFEQFDGKIAALTAKIDTKVNDLNKRIDNKFAAGAADYNSKIGQAVSKIATTTAKANKVKTDIAGKKDGARVVWIGGSRGHMYSGWRQMNFDRVDLDNSGEHFDVKSNYFLIKKAGIYRLCLWGIQHGIGGYRHVVRINGNNMMGEGHKEQGDRYPGRCCSYRNYWEDMHIDQTWHFKQNEKISFHGTAPEYTMHGGTGKSAQNRISFTWIGTNTVGLKM